MLDETSAPLTQSVFSTELRRALRYADTLTFEFAYSSVRLRLSQDRKSDDPFDTRRQVVLSDFKAMIKPGKRDRTYSPPDDPRSVYYSSDSFNTFTPDRGCWSITSLQYCPLVTTAFACVPIGAELEFRVLLDSMSNGYCARAGLHGDVLVMHARKGKIDRSFILDTSIGAHNSARFGFLG